VKCLDLFSGIGGFALAAQREGIETVAFCEIDPFCRRVLAKHWPGVPCHEDITKLDGSQYGGSIDIVCGGYPCQPYSLSGLQRGNADERALWPHVRRVLRECGAQWLFCENVFGHVKNGFEEVASQLEDDGFEVWPFVVPASAVGADHRRERIWIVAHSHGIGREAFLQRESGWGDEASPDWSAGNVDPSSGPAERLSRLEVLSGEPAILGVDDGISHRVDRLRALGNAIYPEIAQLFFRAIRQHDTHINAAKAGK
jgi:DNA (cytosine-5)-methyltransferase 1